VANELEESEHHGALVLVQGEEPALAGFERWAKVSERTKPSK